MRYTLLRKIYLLLVSCLFYINLKPVFAFILFFVTIITYFGGLLLRNVDGRSRRWIAILFVFFASLPLLLFKYYDFLNNSICQAFQLIGLHYAVVGLNWAVPIGISFYTFQAVGYLFDVYRKNIETESNLLDYALFVSFFPQVVSGPISKADELLPQIKSLPRFDYNQAKQGLKFILWGMFLKLVVADRCGLVVDAVFGNPSAYGGGTCIMASCLFSLQIYGDFAGYSLIAIGIARTLGFNLIDNFRRPYFAVSVTDFWKRWHISLTRWLTHYVYIPLGGNRCSTCRCYLNILITFLVSGLWHGANWTFIIWGVMHGLLLIFERFFSCQKYEGKNGLIRFFRILCTFAIVTFAWTIFRMPSTTDAIQFFCRIPSGFAVSHLLAFGGNYITILLFTIAIMLFREVRIEYAFPHLPAFDSKVSKFAFFVLLFCVIILFGVLDGGQFIYSGF